MNDPTLIARVDETQPRWRQAMYQRLSKSAARSPLNRKKVSHAVGDRRERQVDEEPGPRGRPTEHDRAVGPRFADPLRDERHDEQRRVELRRGAQSEATPAARSRRREEGEQPPVPSSTATRSQFTTP